MYYPLRSLREGHWFKLICGASYQHLPAVRSLTLAYTLAGADCVDVAADPAVVAAARDALQVASGLAESAQNQGLHRALNYSGNCPWLMVSLNDGEDPHFRKAIFDPTLCPIDCSRPCEQICPAEAIVFNPANPASADPALHEFSGVIESRCYGCGRCIPICPTQQILTRSYVSTSTAIAPLVLSGVDAVEIHTQVGHWHDFKRLWQSIAPFAPNLKLIAISCPDGDDLIDYLWSLYNLITPLPCALIWQTDGRPMSGDIGDGATRAAVKLGQKVLNAGLPGYVQLAGGTNRHTVSKLQSAGLLKGRMKERTPLIERGMFERNMSDRSLSDRNLFDRNLFDRSLSDRSLSGRGMSTSDISESDVSDRYIAGVAYGSYARTLLSPVLEQLEQRADWQISRLADATHPSIHPPIHPSTHPLISPPLLEAVPDLLWQAVHLADSLVSQLKAPMNLKQTIPR